MQKIILLSGFGGTGKSTVGTLLYEKLGNLALFEADHLFNIKPFVIGEKLGRIKLKNSLALIQNFLEEGYNNIIAVGLVWTQEELDAVVQKFSKDTQIFLIWLEAPKEIRFQRVLMRGEPGDTLEFLEEVEQKLPNPWPFKEEKCKIFKISVEDKSSNEVGNKIIDILSYS